MRRSTSIVIALVAGLAGLLLNTQRPVLFTNIEWVLGGIFPLLVAVACGRWAGLLAGAIAFCLTPQYWFHPFGWITYGLEPFVVGHLVRRHRRSLIAASFLYWGLIGTPVAAVYFTQLGYAAFPANYIALAKYPLNGLIVALIAQEISNRRFFRRLLSKLGSHPPLPDLRQLLISRFSTLTALPILVLSFVAYTALDNRITQSAQDDLQREVRDLRTEFETVLSAAQSDWAGLLASWEAAQAPIADRALQLDAWLARHPQWLDLQIEPASSGPTPPPSAPPAGVPAAAAESLRETAARTAVVRLWLPDPEQRQMIGRATATVDLAQLQTAHFRPRISGGRELILLDAARNPLILPPGITSDRTDRVITRTFTDAFDHSNGHFTHDRWHPAAERMERFRACYTPVPELGWLLVLEEPLWRSQAEAVRLFLATMALAFVAVCLIYLFSRATAAEITAPLHELAHHTAALSRGEIPPLAPSDHAVAAELSQIQRDVAGAAAKLSLTNRELAEAVTERDHSHTELQQVLDQLEHTVQDRTADLKDALTAAESADRTKGEFLGMMSHELRTPLNVMLGSVELLLSGERGGDLTGAQTKSLQTIQDNGRHLLSLIDDVLDFSRDESGKLTLHRESLDPAEPCGVALRLIEPHARHKQIALSAAYEHHVANLSADPKRLRQMVLNLLTNAIKFTASGGKVHLHVHQPDPHQLRITVSDTGIGIPADRLEEIFTPFHQLDRALSREFEGSGLGLTLVRRLAELHGGSVTVESEPGSGSAFHIDLPLPAHPEPRRASAPPPHPVPPPSARPPHRLPDLTPVGAPATGGRRPRVLIVEDNITNADIIRSYLKIMGCDTDLAINGEIGVRRAGEFRPDLILMDVQMPVMDGIEATRRIRADVSPGQSAPPIVMVSALASAADRQRAIDAGAVEYLTKPFSISDFGNMITRHLGNFRPDAT